MARKTTIVTTQDWRSESAGELARLRLLICRMIKNLEEAQQKGGEEAFEEWLWGPRENMLSALSKLTQLLLKILPIEREFHAQTTQTEEELPLSEEDWLLIEAEVAKRKKRR